ncbi:MAG TPA: A/G-specific adenine glycosylase [Methylocella sp.]|nr:A/G-specific adenine glycosylase [Methylocella sp.]
MPAALLAWYDRHRRGLPWRSPPGEPADPYKVWLSEIMLQQTAVAAVKPYFAAFLTRWPDVLSLARAPASEVMLQWAGLGYYSRARNLHRCAQIVAEDFDGMFPRTETALRRLPGIGSYTAAAIAAIAFGQPVLAIDGNVRRVTARLFLISAPPPSIDAAIKARAAHLVPAARPGDFLQALMDLGATVCTPRNPACAICPLQSLCPACQSGDPARFPRKALRQDKPFRRGAAFFIRRCDGAVLVRTRPPKGLLGGMAEIPGTAWDMDYDAASAIGQAPLQANFRRLEQPVTHQFTHFGLRLDVYVAEVPAAVQAPSGHRFVSPCEFGKEAFPSVMKKVIAAARGSQAQQANCSREGLEAPPAI